MGNRAHSYSPNRLCSNFQGFDTLNTSNRAFMHLFLGFYISYGLCMVMMMR